MSSTENLQKSESQSVRLELDRESIWPIRPTIFDGLKEQKCIIAKVDELMALCDRLEAQLTTTHTESRRFLEAVLHEALTPKLNEPV